MSDYRDPATWDSVAWLEWAKVCFDLLKGVAWPLALFCIVWIFRVQLRDRIKDLISVGPTGAVLQPPRQPAMPDSAAGITAKNSLTVGAPGAQHPLPSAQKIVEKIRVQLDAMPEEDRINALSVALAEAQIERQFEFVWGLIFGTQIEALRRLKENGPIQFDDAKRTYDAEVKQNYPELSEWEFDQWAKFLILQELVSQSEGVLSLTELGRDFLVFVDVRKQGQQRGL